MRSDARVQVRLRDVNNRRPLWSGRDENGLFPGAVSVEADPVTQGPITVSRVFALDADGTDKFNNVSSWARNNSTSE